MSVHHNHNHNSSISQQQQSRVIKVEKWREIEGVQRKQRIKQIYGMPQELQLNNKVAYFQELNQHLRSASIHPSMSRHRFISNDIANNVNIHDRIISKQIIRDLKKNRLRLQEFNDQTNNQESSLNRSSIVIMQKEGIEKQQINLNQNENGSGKRMKPLLIQNSTMPSSFDYNKVISENQQQQLDQGKTYNVMPTQSDYSFLTPINGQSTGVNASINRKDNDNLLQEYLQNTKIIQKKEYHLITHTSNNNNNNNSMFLSPSKQRQETNKSQMKKLKKKKKKNNKSVNQKRMQSNSPINNRGQGQIGDQQQKSEFVQKGLSDDDSDDLENKSIDDQDNNDDDDDDDDPTAILVDHYAASHSDINYFIKNNDNKKNKKNNKSNINNNVVEQNNINEQQQYKLDQSELSLSPNLIQKVKSNNDLISETSQILNNQSQIKSQVISPKQSQINKSDYNNHMKQKSLEKVFSLPIVNTNNNNNNNNNNISLELQQFQIKADKLLPLQPHHSFGYEYYSSNNISKQKQYKANKSNKTRYNLNSSLIERSKSPDLNLLINKQQNKSSLNKSVIEDNNNSITIQYSKSPIRNYSSKQYSAKLQKQQFIHLDQNNINLSNNKNNNKIKSYTRDNSRNQRQSFIDKDVKRYLKNQITLKDGSIINQNTSSDRLNEILQQKYTHEIPRKLLLPIKKSQEISSNRIQTEQYINNEEINSIQMNQDQQLREYSQRLLKDYNQLSSQKKQILNKFNKQQSSSLNKHNNTTNCTPINNRQTILPHMNGLRQQNKIRNNNINVGVKYAYIVESEPKFQIKVMPNILQQKNNNNQEIIYITPLKQTINESQQQQQSMIYSQGQTLKTQQNDNKYSNYSIQNSRNSISITKQTNLNQSQKIKKSKKNSQISSQEHLEYLQNVQKNHMKSQYSDDNVVIEFDNHNNSPIKKQNSEEEEQQCLNSFQKINNSEDHNNNVVVVEKNLSNQVSVKDNQQNNTHIDNSQISIQPNNNNNFISSLQNITDNNNNIIKQNETKKTNDDLNENDNNSNNQQNLSKPPLCSQCSSHLHTPLLKQSSIKETNIILNQNEQTNDKNIKNQDVEQRNKKDIINIDKNDKNNDEKEDKNITQKENNHATQNDTDKEKQINLQDIHNENKISSQKVDEDQIKNNENITNQNETSSKQNQIKENEQEKQSQTQENNNNKNDQNTSEQQKQPKKLELMKEKKLLQLNDMYQYQLNLNYTDKDIEQIQNRLQQQTIKKRRLCCLEPFFTKAEHVIWVDNFQIKIDSSQQNQMVFKMRIGNTAEESKIYLKYDAKEITDEWIFTKQINSLKCLPLDQSEGIVLLGKNNKTSLKSFYSIIYLQSLQFDSADLDYQYVNYSEEFMKIIKSFCINYYFTYIFQNGIIQDNQASNNNIQNKPMFESNKNTVAQNQSVQLNKNDSNNNKNNANNSNNNNNNANIVNISKNTNNNANNSNINNTNPTNNNNNLNNIQNQTNQNIYTSKTQQPQCLQMNSFPIYFPHSNTIGFENEIYMDIETMNMHVKRNNIQYSEKQLLLLLLNILENISMFHSNNISINNININNIIYSPETYTFKLLSYVHCELNEDCLTPRQLTQLEFKYNQDQIYFSNKHNNAYKRDLYALGIAAIIFKYQLTEYTLNHDVIQDKIQNLKDSMVNQNSNSNNDMSTKIILDLIEQSDIMRSSEIAKIFLDKYFYNNQQESNNVQNSQNIVLQNTLQKQNSFQNDQSSNVLNGIMSQQNSMHEQQINNPLQNNHRNILKSQASIEIAQQQNQDIKQLKDSSMTMRRADFNNNVSSGGKKKDIFENCNLFDGINQKNSNNNNSISSNIQIQELQILKKCFEHCGKINQFFQSYQNILDTQKQTYGLSSSLYLESLIDFYFEALNHNQKDRVYNILDYIEKENLFVFISQIPKNAQSLRFMLVSAFLFLADKNIDKAMKYFDRTLAFPNLTFQDLFQLNLNLGILASQKQKKSKALLYLKQSQLIAKSIQKPSINLAAPYLLSGIINEDENDLQTALEIKRNNNEEETKIMNLMFKIGSLCLKKKNFSKGEDIFRDYIQYRDGVIEDQSKKNQFFQAKLNLSFCLLGQNSNHPILHVLINDYLMELRQIYGQQSKETLYALYEISEVLINLNVNQKEIIPVYIQCQQIATLLNENKLIQELENKLNQLKKIN